MCTRFLAAVVFATALAGCFYVDPINERPSADIERIDPELPFRGDEVTVYAEIFDPDGDRTTATWTAYACTDDSCDERKWADGGDYTFTFDAPTHTKDTLEPATRVRVELVVQDEHHAITVPTQSLDINLANRNPSFTALNPFGYLYEGAFPICFHDDESDEEVCPPVTVQQRLGDEDDDPETLVLDETVVFAQIPAEAQTDDAIVTLDEISPEEGEATWKIAARVPGTWIFRFSGHDPLGEPVTTDETIVFADDRAPCIRLADPVFPPTGARIILDQPTRFAVVSVDDDLDLFPAPVIGNSEDPRRAASFRWYLADPSTGGALAELDVDGNAIDLDPGAYLPGDLLELRVEAVDRLDRALCDSSLPACEDVGRPGGCWQRRTWAVEVR